jgi:hypothetical protein
MYAGGLPSVSKFMKSIPGGAEPFIWRRAGPLRGVVRPGMAPSGRAMDAAEG